MAFVKLEINSLFSSIKLILAEYEVYGTTPPNSPTDATTYPYPFFSRSNALGSNKAQINIYHINR